MYDKEMTFFNGSLFLKGLTPFDCETKTKVLDIVSGKTYRVMSYDQKANIVTLLDQFTLQDDIVRTTEDLRIIMVIDNDTKETYELDKKSWDAVAGSLDKPIQYILRMVSVLESDHKKPIAFLKREKNVIQSGFITFSKRESKIVVLSRENGREYVMIENQRLTAVEKGDAIRRKPVNFYTENRGGVDFAVVIRANYKKWEDEDLYNAYIAGADRREYDLKGSVEGNKIEPPKFKQWKIDYEKQRTTIKNDGREQANDSL